MPDLKTDALEFLNARTERDASAAQMLAACDIEIRAAAGANAGEHAIDVLLHAKHEIASTAHNGDWAGRIENAIRESALPRVRHLQWVETTEDTGPRSGRGVGDSDVDTYGQGTGRERDRHWNDDPGRSGDHNTQRSGSEPVSRRQNAR